MQKHGLPTASRLQRGQPYVRWFTLGETFRCLGFRFSRRVHETLSESADIPRDFLKHRPDGEPRIRPTDIGVRLEAPVKKLIIATATALGLASAGDVTLAQDQTQTTQLQNVVVTGVRAPYETYVTRLPTGYQLQALVGHTHKQFMQAQRAADRSEALRRQGLATQPLVSVAIDDSFGPGVARQVQLINADRETVAIVNVYCKRAVPSEGARCRMAPQPTRASRTGERLASIPAAAVRLAAVDVRK